MRGWPQDDLTPLRILGPPDHGGQGRRILWTYVQRVPYSNPMRPPVTHDIQCGRGRRHLPLSDGGAANCRWIGGTGPVVRGIGSIFLYQQWPCHVNPIREATEGVQHPHWPLWPGRPKDEHEEDGHHDMPAMPCAWPDVFGSVQAADDGDRKKLPGTTEEEGGLTRVQGGGHGRVASEALSESTRCGEGGPGRDPPPPSPGRPKLTGSLS